MLIRAPPARLGKIWCKSFFLGHFDAAQKDSILLWPVLGANSDSARDGRELPEVAVVPVSKQIKRLACFGLNVQFQGKIQTGASLLRYIGLLFSLSHDRSSLLFGSPIPTTLTHSPFFRTKLVSTPSA